VGFLIERSRKRKDYFTGCLPWPQKGTASFISDTGNLAVESIPQYPVPPRASRSNIRWTAIASLRALTVV
jgi:hypothetical protein